MTRCSVRTPLVLQNQSGGHYATGRAYGLEKKHEVACMIKAFGPDSSSEQKLSYREIGRQCKVSDSFVRKIRDELNEFDDIQDPKTATRNCPRGPGSKSFDEFDVQLLLAIRRIQPCTSLSTYQVLMFRFTGKFISTSTISKVFNYGFEFRGSLRKPDYVPFDKFKPMNLARLLDFQAVMVLLKDHFGDHRRLKFCDEKPIKGEELYAHRPRRDPETGTVPFVSIPSDFRNTYNVVGFCGVDRTTTPVYYNILQGTVDSEVFNDILYQAVVDGFLKPFDFLVIDNAAPHTGKESSDLKDRMWDHFRIVVLFLPTRSPELNPIELVWHQASQKMIRMDISALCLEGSHPIARAAARAYDEFTHHDIEKLYIHDGYYLL